MLKPQADNDIAVILPNLNNRNYKHNPEGNARKTTPETAQWLRTGKWSWYPVYSRSGLCRDARDCHGYAQRANGH